MNTKRNMKILIPIGMITLILAFLAVIIPMDPVRADSSDTITFSNNSITTNGTGTGYTISGTTLTITKAGTYTVTGSCGEGSIVIGKEVTGVNLIFNNLTLSSSTTAPVVLKKSAEATIELVGTNTLTDVEDASTEDTNSDFEGAGIKIKSGSTLTIKGSGTLNVNAANCKNGIKGAATSTLNIQNGNIIVNAANHAIAADGTVNLSSGTYKLTSGNEGIKASPDDDDTESAGVIMISGGTYTINSADDAIHGDNAVTITGGTFTINAGDDAIHSDYTTTIGVNGSTSGPDITVSSCYEAVEGAVVNLYSGTANMTASDDGINAANSDLTNYAFAINITGGAWYVNADGDGLDSNGTVTISGGKTEVFGSVNGGNAALDYDRTCTLTGGTLIAVGNSGMAQAVSGGKCITYNNVSVNKGTTIEINNSAGSTVYSTTGVKNANHIVFASTELSESEKYTLYLNGTSVASTDTASVQAGGQPGQPGQGGQPPQGGQPSQDGQQGQGGQPPQDGQQGQGGQPPQDGQQSQDGQQGQDGQSGIRPAQGPRQAAVNYSNEWVNGQWYAKDGNTSYSYKGSWKHNSKGWWYEDESGWYPRNRWQKIDGKWYYFNAQGYMESNCYRGGYWLSKTGAYDPTYNGSWKKNSTGWWYQDSTGWYPKNQWLKIDGKWYYFNAKGYLVTDSVVDGYTVGSDGAWIQK